MLQASLDDRIALIHKQHKPISKYSPSVTYIFTLMYFNVSASIWCANVFTHLLAYFGVAYKEMIISYQYQLLNAIVEDVTIIIRITNRVS